MEWLKHFTDLWLIINTNSTMPSCNLHGKAKMWLGQIEANIEHNLDNFLINVANAIVVVPDNAKTFKKIISMKDGYVLVKEAIHRYQYIQGRGIHNN